MKYLPKPAIYTLLGLGLVTFIFLAMRPTPLHVETVSVKRDSLLVTVNAEGKTRIRSRFVVSNSVAGRLTRIQLKEGDTVRRGSVVASIEPLPLDTRLKVAQANLRELQAQRIGVATQRPKQEALLQAQAKIRSAEALKNQAQAKVNQVKATLEQAKRDLQRNQNLLKDGAISRQDLENTQLSYITRIRELEVEQRQVESAEAEVAAAQEALDLLRAQQQDPDYLLNVYDARIASAESEIRDLSENAARSDIRSPINGKVLRVLQESAKYVEAGTPLLEVGNSSDIELVIDVLSSDAVKIKPGADILVQRWGGEKTLKAKVRKVEPSAFTKVSALGVEEQRVNVIADFVDASTALGDNYRVDAQIIVWRGDDVLTVPLSSLFRCQGSWCSFVVENGKARIRLVEISHRNSFAASIQKGLTDGETVILYPTEEIKEGKEISGT